MQNLCKMSLLKKLDILFIEHLKDRQIEERIEVLPVTHRLGFIGHLCSQHILIQVLGACKDAATQQVRQLLNYFILNYWIHRRQAWVKAWERVSGLPGNKQKPDRPLPSKDLFASCTCRTFSCSLIRNKELWCKIYTAIMRGFVSMILIIL